jgi:arylsulfatase
MIAYWPGKVAKGQWTDHTGHLIDFTPTMLELAGSKIPETLPGQSLVPALKGKPTKQSRPLYWSYGGSALRDGEWKLVGRKKTWELYNLAEDPTETNNLAKEHPDRVQKMVKQWQAWKDDKGVVE